MLFKSLTESVMQWYRMASVEEVTVLTPSLSMVLLLMWHNNCLTPLCLQHQNCGR